MANGDKFEKDLDELRSEKAEELREGDEAREAAEDQRKEVRHMAAQYLTKEARERLGSLRTARPELVSMVEMQIAQLGRKGQIKKLSDDQLKDILQKLEGEKEDRNIKFRR